MAPSYFLEKLKGGQMHRRRSSGMLATRFNFTYVCFFQLEVRIGLHKTTGSLLHFLYSEIHYGVSTAMHNCGAINQCMKMLCASHEGPL